MSHIKLTKARTGTEFHMPAHWAFEDARHRERLSDSCRSFVYDTLADSNKVVEVSETPEQIAALIAAARREELFQERIHRAAAEVLTGMWAFSGYGGSSMVINGDPENRVQSAANEGLALVRAVDAALAAEKEVRP